MFESNLSNRSISLSAINVKCFIFPHFQICLDNFHFIITWDCCAWLSLFCVLLKININPSQPQILCKFFVIKFYCENFILCVCTTYLTVSCNNSSPAQDFLVNNTYISTFNWSLKWRQEENVGWWHYSHVYYILLLWRDKTEYFKKYTLYKILSFSPPRKLYALSQVWPWPCYR